MGDAVALGIAADVRPGDPKQRLKRRSIAGAGGLDQRWIDPGDGAS